MEMVELGQVKRIIMAHRDRLVRFGYDYFEAFCERHHTDIVVINGENLSPEQELVRGLDCYRDSVFCWVRRTEIVQKSAERRGSAQRVGSRYS